MWSLGSVMNCFVTIIAKENQNPKTIQTPNPPNPKLKLTQTQNPRSKAIYKTQNPKIQRIWYWYMPTWPENFLNGLWLDLGTAVTWLDLCRNITDLLISGLYTHSLPVWIWKVTHTVTICDRTCSTWVIMINCLMIFLLKIYI
jgi:hypothetical protein